MDRAKRKAFCPKTLVFAVFPAAVCFPCHCEPRSGVAISCRVVPASVIIPCHCEARRAVAIRFPYSFIYEKRTKRSTDCQEVNCPEGAREATLGCASLRPGSQRYRFSTDTATNRQEIATASGACLAMTRGWARGLRIATPVCGLARNDMVDGLGKERPQARKNRTKSFLVRSLSEICNL